MFNKFSEQQHKIYNTTRNYFIENPEKLIEVERTISLLVLETIKEHKEVFRTSYDEASYLFPFWKNYQPEDRGRSPRGDQIPWIEVGEHAIGANLSRILGNKIQVREVGLPSGTDQRFKISDESIKKACGLTDSVMLFLDVKSVGPRDDFDHTVLSTYQVSGNGVWANKNEGVKNSVVKAVGKIASHDFHCALPPIYVFSDGTVAPTVSIFIKPRYEMIYEDELREVCVGQPLDKVTCVSLPNGLLLSVNPNYLKKYPGFFYPGKDDKAKAKNKMRARVSFKLLQETGNWRVTTVHF